ncbi:hypothetical protein HOP50_09g56020 [Chloropicon primus]|nr:hypothetical protein HOP50_09g56020 [Chloropicon primus]
MFEVFVEGAENGVSALPGPGSGVENMVYSAHHKGVGVQANQILKSSSVKDGGLGKKGKGERKPFGGVSRSELNTRRTGGLGEVKKPAHAHRRKHEQKQQLKKSAVEGKAIEEIPSFPRKSRPKSVEVPKDAFAKPVSHKDLPVSPTDSTFRTNVLQEAILANAESVSGSDRASVKAESLSLGERGRATFPISPSDVSCHKNLRREAILQNARASTTEVVTKVKGGPGARSRLPPSPTDLILHENLRHKAIMLNARRQAMQGGAENLTTKFEDSTQ